MRLDPIVKRRFEESASKAEAVLAAKVYDFTGESGWRYHRLPSAMVKEWGTNVLSLLGRVFGKDSVHYSAFVKQHRDGNDEHDHSFEDARAIFNAAREDYEGGYLFNVRSLAKAEVLTDALSQARDLLAAGYKDPACILGRIALESTLKDLVEKHGFAAGKLDRMNAELSKANVYNMAKHKQITAWAEIGNKAWHGQWDQYSEGDARAMIDGVEALVADLMS